MGLDARRRRNVEFGALLHDVGKIAIPKEIINKTGPLDDDEWEIMRTHTIEGQQMLDTVGGVLAEVGRSCAPRTSTRTAAATPTASPARTSRSRPGSSPAATRSAR